MVKSQSDMSQLGTENSVGQLAVGQLAVGQLAVGQLAVGQLAVGHEFVRDIKRCLMYVGRCK
jgi:hypothetical protein